MPDTTTTYESKVEAGMDLLDEKVPGWELSVNLDRLDQYESQWTEVGWSSPDEFDQSHNCGCVLVQVFGSYDDGMDRLNISWQNSGTFGFNLGLNDHSFRTLTSCWKRLFRARYKEGRT